MLDEWFIKSFNYHLLMITKYKKNPKKTQFCKKLDTPKHVDLMVALDEKFQDHDWKKF